MLSCEGCYDDCENDCCPMDKFQKHIMNEMVKEVEIKVIK
jgi:hypothetical protein